MRRTGLWAVALAAAVLASAVVPTGALATARGPGSRNAAASATSLPDFSHVIVLVMENKEYGQVIGNASAPYINGLASNYSLATRFYAVSHPSLPNYLAMIGGSTFGITSDCTSCSVNATNLVDQLEGAGISWKAYMEDMPGPCYKGGYAGKYAKKHDPFMYFKDVYSNATRCQNVVPMTQLTTDLGSGSLPRFAFITPNLCHDMHDCSVKVGDNFLSTLVPQLLPALGTNGVLFLTWDEGSTNAGCCTYAHGGHVATIVAGPGALASTTSSVGYDTYSILKTIETAWGLAPLGKAACKCTAVMSDLV